MAITPIMQVQKPKRSKLETVALALQMAEGVLGTALRIGEYKREGDVIKQKAPTEIELATKKREEEIKQFMLEEPSDEIKADISKKTGIPPDYFKTREMIFKYLPEKDKGMAEKNEWARKLRGEYTDLSKSYKFIQESYGRIIVSGKNPSAAGDLALIFNYMKMLDPGSVVRESEFATAQNAAGIPDRIRNIYNRVLSGQRLAPDQRNDFIDRSDKLYVAAKITHKPIKSKYSDLSLRYMIDPDEVIIDYDSAIDELKAQTATPAKHKKVTQEDLESF